MSRIGKLPIKVPNDIKVSIDGNTITLTKGNKVRSYNFGDTVNVKFENQEIEVSKNEQIAKRSNFWGLHRNNIHNLVVGLAEGFKNILEFEGVGYRAAVSGKFLVLGLGYSHDIALLIPDEISIKVDKNLIIIEGCDKELVGRIGARIISFRETEPYKGKGIKKQGQYVVRKEGKKK